MQMKQFLYLSVSLFLFGINPTLLAQVQPGNLEPNRPILRIGTEGTSVSQVQGVLKLLGFYQGEVNGIYDENTQMAVSRFQEAAGLEVDGILGNNTWNRLLPFKP